MTAPALWRDGAPLVLASNSATRRALLASTGLPFEARAPDFDERAAEADLAGSSPLALARALARGKALAVEAPGSLVVGADQVLALEDRVLHKPADAGEARRHLGALAGRRHALHAAVAIVRDGRVLAAFDETAWLSMRPLGDEAIARYVALAGEAEVTASVGGYRLEGLGVHLFESVEGGHSAVLGLPLLPLLAALRELGALVL